MKRKYVLFFALVALMYLPAFGANTPQIVTEKNREGRLRYAKELLSFIEKINNQIPSLSPSQEEWLTKEFDEHSKPEFNWTRCIEVGKTKEYNIDIVKGNLAEMILFLNKIILNSEIKKPSLGDEKKEIYWWLVIVNSLMNDVFWQDLLILIEDFKVVDSKLFSLDSKQYANPSQQMFLFYANNGMWPARQILKNIITPYLRDNSDPNQPKQKAID